MAPHEDVAARVGTAFEAIVDAPLVLSFAACGEWPRLVQDLGGSPSVAQNTPVELREAWARNETVSDRINEEELRVIPIPDPVAKRSRRNTNRTLSTPPRARTRARCWIRGMMTLGWGIGAWLTATETATSKALGATW